MPNIAEQRRIAKVCRHLVDKAVELIDSLDEEAIAAAPLNQRTAALGTVIDRLIKLTDLNEAARHAAHTGEKVVRIEYRDPDGTIHSTPHWARKDHAEPDALQGRGVWAAIWQDRTGENAAD